MKDASFLGKLFSSPFIRGFYNDEKPVVDIKLEGNKFEQRRMTSLINTIARNSPTGRAILEDAAKAGYTFSFERQRGSYGFCDPSEKRICLNPMHNDAKLTGTLAHEARHAQQHTKDVPTKFCTLNVATELKLRRATESDAQAVAAQTALEIRAATRNEKIWNAFEETDRHIALSVGKPSVFKSLDSVVADRDKNMQNAFKGWFNDWRTIDAYEQGYLYHHLRAVARCEPEEKAAYFAQKPFEGHKTSADILKMVCTTEKGKCYFANDLDIMDRETAMCGICQDTREAADMFFSERKKVTGKAPDTSYQNLPDRGDLFKALKMMMMPIGEIKVTKAPLDKKALPPSLIAGLNKIRQGR
ncbi:MAG: hypothetical protein IJ752_01050 [Alphaproteobacteria bacterium]|nr:hypothetical protein [Alphaproteobacteria bacterium]